MKASWWSRSVRHAYSGNHHYQQSQSSIARRVTKSMIILLRVVDGAERPSFTSAVQSFADDGFQRSLQLRVWLRTQKALCTSIDNRRRSVDIADTRRRRPQQQQQQLDVVGGVYVQSRFRQRSQRLTFASCHSPYHVMGTLAVVA